MNKLDADARSQILHMACEGQSIRSIERISGASKNTIAKLLVDTGAVCAAYQNEAFRELPCQRIQVDEIWSFTYAKAKHPAAARAAPENTSDTWTWTAICADTKLVPSWLVGGRDSEYAMAFMDDLVSRLTNRVQLISDGHRAYLKAVEGAFDADVDYAMLVALYGASPEAAKGRCNPTECISARKDWIRGNPDSHHLSTSYAERQNLTMRMHMRRFTRVTNGLSKKVEKHANAVALHFMYYNFVRVHETLRMTPGMSAGVTDRLWEVADIVKLLEAKEAEQPKVRGPSA